jgi:hypothetical protein
VIITGGTLGTMRCINEPIARPMVTNTSIATIAIANASFEYINPNQKCQNYSFEYINPNQNCQNYSFEYINPSDVINDSRFPIANDIMVVERKRTKA